MIAKPDVLAAIRATAADLRARLAAEVRDEDQEARAVMQRPVIAPEHDAMMHRNIGRYIGWMRRNRCRDELPTMPRFLGRQLLELPRWLTERPG